MDKDTTIQLRVSSEMAERARKVFEREGRTISEAVRGFLEESIRQGKSAIRPKRSTSEDSYREMLRKEEECLDTICMPEYKRMNKPKADEECTAEDLSDTELMEWAGSIGLPETLTLSTLADLYDCGVFPRELPGVFECENVPMGVEWSTTMIAKNLKANALIYMAERKGDK